MDVARDTEAAISSDGNPATAAVAEGFERKSPAPRVTPPLRHRKTNNKKTTPAAFMVAGGLFRIRFWQIDPFLNLWFILMPLYWSPTGD
jgi:hypothetical protein